MPDPGLPLIALRRTYGVAKNTVYVGSRTEGRACSQLGQPWRFQTSEVDEWVQSGSGGRLGEDESLRGT